MFVSAANFCATMWTLSVSASVFLFMCLWVSMDMELWAWVCAMDVPLVFVWERRDDLKQG